MRTVLSVRSAAELASVTESAILHAVKAGRIAKPLIFYTGSRPTNWICLDSLKNAYRLTAADIDRYEQWLDSIGTEPPTVMTAGTTWRLVDRGNVFHVTPEA